MLRKNTQASSATSRIIIIHMDTLMVYLHSYFLFLYYSSYCTLYQNNIYVQKLFFCTLETIFDFKIVTLDNPIDLKWPHWPQMTSNDLKWPQMTFVSSNGLCDLKWSQIGHAISKGNFLARKRTFDTVCDYCPNLLFWEKGWKLRNAMLAINSGEMLTFHFLPKAPLWWYNECENER